MVVTAVHQCQDLELYALSNGYKIQETLFNVGLYTETLAQ